MKKFLMMAMVVSTLALAGCGDSPEDVMGAAAAEAFEENLCLNIVRSWPHRVYRRPSVVLAPLVEEGFVTQDEVKASHGGGSEFVYTLTSKGMKTSTEDGMFCYGKQKFVRLEGFTPPEDGLKPGQRFPVRVVVERVVTEDWANHPGLVSKVTKGEVSLPGVLSVKQDGTISVIK